MARLIPLNTMTLTTKFRSEVDTPGDGGEQ